MSLPQLVIASRESALALWQAEHVRDSLLERYPGAAPSTIVPLTHARRPRSSTARSRRSAARACSSRNSNRARGRARRYRRALDEGRADGLPARASLSLHLRARRPARCLRLQPLRDARRAAARARSSAPRACAAKRSCARALPASTCRAAARQRQHAPGQARPGRYDAIILAAAGLKRLGLEDRITRVLASRRQPAGAGPGRARHRVPRRRRDLHCDLLAPLQRSRDTAAAVARRARRVAARSAAAARFRSEPLPSARRRDLRLRGARCHSRRHGLVRADATGPASAPEELGARVASALRAEGADAILAALDAHG